MPEKVIPQPTVTTDATATTSQDDDKNSTATAPDADTQTAKDKTGTPELRFTQADVTRIVKKELDAERTKHKKTSEEIAAKQSGEFEKLANTYKAELDVLTTEHQSLKDTYESLTEKVTALVKSELKGLPETVRELAPSDAVQLLEWLPKAKKTAETMVGRPAEKGNDRGPKPTGTTPGDEVKSIKESLRSRGRYTGF